MSNMKLEKIGGKNWFTCPACGEKFSLEPKNVGTVGEFGVECKLCYKGRLHVEKTYYRVMMTKRGR